MELRRSVSNQSGELNRFQNGSPAQKRKVTKHPGFVSISPQSTPNSAIPASTRSPVENERVENTLKISSQSIETDYSDSPGNQLSRKPSNKSFNSKRIRNLPQSRRTQYHGKCVDSDSTSTAIRNAVPNRLDTFRSKSGAQLVPNSNSRSTAQGSIAVLKEKYSKLKEEYNSKVEEVSSARVELEKAVREAVVWNDKCRLAEKRASDLTMRVKESEMDKMKMFNTRDKMIEMENQLAMARQKHRESLEDVEEAKRILKEQLEAVDNTRALYLETEQLAEEQSRKLRNLELENERLSQQVAFSMDKAREQFQLHVFELGPLADSVSLMKGAISKNKERQNHADQKADVLRNEIVKLTERNEELKRQLNEIAQNLAEVDKEKMALRKKIEGREAENEEARREKLFLTGRIEELKEMNDESQMHLQSKEREVLELAAGLETLREECARQISSNKTTLVGARKNHLKRLLALEKDLAKTKADEKTAEKEREAIRLRLEEQIESLSHNLFQAREKIQCLQENLGFVGKDRDVKVRRASGLKNR